MRTSSLLAASAAFAACLAGPPTIDAFVVPQSVPNGVLGTRSSRLQVPFLSQPKPSRASKQSAFDVPSRVSPTSSALRMAESSNGKNTSLPFWLDPGTKGGAIVLSLVLFVVPLLGYAFVTNVLGYDSIEAGKWIGIGFTVLSTFAWVSTYIFRVATKDMTYAKQLKDYENAVIAKRLEELDEDEIQALVEEIERDEF